jgi:hypothetical protein
VFINTERVKCTLAVAASMGGCRDKMVAKEADKYIRPPLTMVTMQAAQEVSDAVKLLITH